jgi:hypothetical protein
MLGQLKCFLDAQARAPQHDDHRSHARAVTVIGSVTHSRHDLVDRWRVGRVSNPFVTRRLAGVVARQRRRRWTPPRRVENG